LTLHSGSTTILSDGLPWYKEWLVAIDAN